MRRLTIGLALVVTSFGIAACGDGDGPLSGGHACTEIGCGSGVTVEIPEAANGAEKATLCVDGRCRTSPIRGHAPSFLSVRCRAEPDTVRVLIAFRGGADQVVRRTSALAELRRLQPNGPDCPPTCWQANFKYSVAANTLIERRS